ncbi:hypothetical protein ScalyP_jg2847 [Parmales sp. scaly parma]|nr:hypothetical protein ScalyP_jg2847 [Parmales sp. scaly parma]|tara:strand:- start:153 stop:635 length:483 start_codon:yes stop_codon:yes gene_type:complete
MKLVPLTQLCLLLVNAQAVIGVAVDQNNDLTPSEDCIISRPVVIACAAKFLDTNHNNNLDREELEYAISQLNFLARKVLTIIGSVDAIMEKCDHDKDGAISIHADMGATTTTCLASCYKRRAFKAAFFPDCDITNEQLLDARRIEQETNAHNAEVLNKEL